MATTPNLLSQENQYRFNHGELGAKGLGWHAGAPSQWSSGPMPSLLGSALWVSHISASLTLSADLVSDSSGLPPPIATLQPALLASEQKHFFLSHMAATARPFSSSFLTSFSSISSSWPPKANFWGAHNSFFKPHSKAAHLILHLPNAGSSNCSWVLRLFPPLSTNWQPLCGILTSRRSVYSFICLFFLHVDLKYLKKKKKTFNKYLWISLCARNWQLFLCSATYLHI